VAKAEGGAAEHRSTASTTCMHPSTAPIHHMHASTGEHSKRVACHGLRLGDRSLGDRSLGDRSLGDRSLGDRSLGDRSLGDRSLGDRSLGGSHCPRPDYPRRVPAASAPPSARSP
jgi:hypothetical protein